MIGEQARRFLSLKKKNKLVNAKGQTHTKDKIRSKRIKASRPKDAERYNEEDCWRIESESRTIFFFAKMRKKKYGSPCRRTTKKL